MNRAGEILTVVAAALVLGVGTARAQSGTASWRLDAGAAAGGLGLDRHLADYRWDVSPAATWGAQAAVTRGPVACGLRAWRARTTQGTGLTAGPTDLHVALTGIELAAQARVLTVANFQLWTAVLGGRLHGGYDPDRLTATVGGGEPVTVEFAPLDAWTWGLGVEVRRPLGRSLGLALQAERTSFGLDTAHRRGADVVTERETFHNWSARLLVAWSWSLS